MATLDGQVVGGVLIGPAMQFIADFAAAHNLGGSAVIQALLYTSKLHLVAVDEDHRRQGLGQALVGAATATAFHGGVQMLYGQYLTADRGLAAFYRRQGFVSLPPTEPLNFSRWLGGFPGGPAPLAGETFFFRLL